MSILVYLHTGERMRISLLLFLLYFSISSISQVTIGSHLEPNQGALLDLKQFLPDESNATATKGLQLPRVELKKISGDLSESLGLSEAIVGAAHIGLTVYNIADAVCPLFPSGVYTWNGSQWDNLYGEGVKSLYSYTENRDGSGTGILTDYEGNEYTTKRFTGTVNGVAYNKVWMTQNLRSLKNANGEWISCPGGIPLNPAFHIYPTSIPSILVTTEIPEGTVETYTYRGVLKEGQSYKNLDCFILKSKGVRFAPKDGICLLRQNGKICSQ